ncbi:MAG: general secretion pathway protein J [Paraglaciecola psychrophila]|jgi:general secretion pathway protein J
MIVAVKSLARRRYLAGLTLLEVLIALSIFALIGVASYRMLASVISAQQITNEHSVALGQLQKAMLIMGRDLEQGVARPIRLSTGAELPALLVNSGDFKLELTRTGRTNPLQLPRSSLQRVAYEVGLHPYRDRSTSPFFGDERTYLLRHYWLSLDRSGSSAAQVQALLAAVESIELRVFSDRGEQRQWPPASGARNGDGTSKPVPQLLAIEVRIDHAQFGQIDRLFKVN